MRLPLDYFRHHDVLYLSRNLLGKFLMTRIEGATTGGMIIETEAYCGPEDRASHAYGGRRTKRTEVMFKEGGHCYVYLCYGIHHLFNIITNDKDIPHGILIRAIHPVVGIPKMLERRGKKKLDKTLTSGPGSLTKALGIELRHNASMLNGAEIWLEDRGVSVDPNKITVGPRVGVDFAGDDALLPWRFRFRPE